MLNCFFAIEVCFGNGAVLWVFDVRVCDAITARYIIFRDKLRDCGSDVFSRLGLISFANTRHFLLPPSAGPKQSSLKVPEDADKA